MKCLANTGASAWSAGSIALRGRNVSEKTWYNRNSRRKFTTRGSSRLAGSSTQFVGNPPLDASPRSLPYFFLVEEIELDVIEVDTQYDEAEGQ